MAIAPPGLVTGPPRTALPFGLFSVFTFRGSSERWEAGVQWETISCDPAGGRGADNCGESAVIGLPKELGPNNGEVGQGLPFTVYGHFSCSPLGYTPATAQSKATEHLEAREEARAEQAFWTGDLGNTPFLADDPTVLAGGTAMPPPAGLAILEDFIAYNYGGVGVIHLSRGAALQAIAYRAVEAKNGKLTTGLGTPVVAGAGYPGTGPGGTSAGEGESWAYVSPAVFGYRSEVFSSSNRAGDLLDRTTNDLYAIAERIYLLGYDPCGVGAVTLDLNATPGSI